LIGRLKADVDRDMPEGVSGAWIAQNHPLADLAPAGESAAGFCGGEEAALVLPGGGSLFVGVDEQQMLIHFRAKAWVITEASCRYG
jgi:hypothetical protein